VYTPNNAACSDGNGCTTDLCLGGQCRGAIDDKRLMLRFESLSNGTTPDTSGMGSVVAALGNVVVAPGGSSGGASSASFPGNDATSAIRVPGAAITGKSFTFSAWVRPSVGGARYFVGRTSSASSNGLVLGVNGHLILHGTGITDGLAPLKVGDWTHLTLTYDGTTLRVYQNGLPSRLHPISSNASWTSDLWLGQEIDCAEGCTSASQAFGGRLDNVAWFNKVLTANEVGNLFRDQNIQCADDGFCTFDSCIGGSCLNTPTQSACDDGNPCTEDTCSAAGDCSYVRTVTLCEDDLPVENLWGGVWDNSGGDTEIVSDLTQTELVEAWNSGGPSGGQRLMDIEVRMVVGQPRFDALFRAGTGQSALWIYTQQAFLNQVITYNSGNLRLADFETFVDNGTRYYIGSWTHQPATGADTVLLGLTWDTLTAEHAARTNNGSRMVDLDVYIDNGALRYNAHFRPGAGPHGLIGTNWEHFSATVEGTSAALVDFEAIQFQGSWLYFGVWSGTDSSRRMVGGYGKSQFDDQRAAWEAQGYHLIDLERRPGEPVPPTEISASLWNTLKPYAMGFTYSVGKNGEPLGYGAQGLGRVAGNGASTNLPLNTLSRMHLASVSKTLSGAAWAVYNDQSGIDFDQPFWPWVSHRFPFADEDVKLMTFRQLLSHRGGFTDAQYYDACEPPLAVSVSVVLEIGPYEPLGEGDYTNSSTCIGRLLLEELTGVPYVQWVTTHVLSPSGAHDTTPTVLQSSTETLYYGNGGEPIEEYGFDDIFENFLDDYNNVVSAWGWYSSSRDLLNYLLALRNGDIVSEAAMNEMFTTEMGFFDIQTDGGTGYWHNGAWGGTYYVGGKEVTAGVATVAMHLPKGIDLVLLVNTQDINALDQAATAYDAWLAQNGGFVIQIPPIVDILP
jgi:CubicO group peptidase (beta-lactamase class C family)